MFAFLIVSILVTPDENLKPPVSLLVPLSPKHTPVHVSLPSCKYGASLLLISVHTWHSSPPTPCFTSLAHCFWLCFTAPWIFTFSVSFSFTDTLCLASTDFNSSSLSWIPQPFHALSHPVFTLSIDHRIICKHQRPRRLLPDLLSQPAHYHCK